jgi:hypothetical protein
MNGCKFGMAAALLICSYSAFGQALTSSDELPDAPSAAIQTAPTRQLGNTQRTAQVDGIVQDIQGNPVPQASVTLTPAGKLGERTTTAGDDGSYTFTAVPAGDYRLTVTSPGLDTYTSGEFAVRSGATAAAPKTPMKISTSTSINVTASPDEVAAAQVHEQEKQRVFGVSQNFYTSYIWNAAPMSAKQKYKLAFRTMGDPTTFVILAGVAGAEQYNGTYPGYGPGIEGYGKRYGAALADSVTGRIVGSAVLPALLHQDPRYFYQGSGSFGSRTWHALSSTLICRGDNGKTQLNYSRVLGDLAAGGLANTYHPESSRGVGLTFQTLGVNLAANSIGNLAREFILRHLEPSVPNYANGK